MSDYNDYFRSSEFYSGDGIWSGQEGKQRQHFIALVPIIRYREEPPANQPHLCTRSVVSPETITGFVELTASQKSHLKRRSKQRTAATKARNKLHREQVYKAQVANILAEMRPGRVSDLSRSTQWEQVVERLESGDIPQMDNFVGEPYNYL